MSERLLYEDEQLMEDLQNENWKLRKQVELLNKELSDLNVILLDHGIVTQEDGSYVYDD